MNLLGKLALLFGNKVEDAKIKYLTDEITKSVTENLRATIVEDLKVELKNEVKITQNYKEYKTKYDLLSQDTRLIWKALLAYNSEKKCSFGLSYHYHTIVNNREFFYKRFFSISEFYSFCKEGLEEPNYPKDLEYLENIFLNYCWDSETNSLGLDSKKTEVHECWARDDDKLNSNAILAVYEEVVNFFNNEHPELLF